MPLQRTTTARSEAAPTTDAPLPADDAVDFVARHGIVLLSARGPVPSLARAIAGEDIRGSWWGHPRGNEIFQGACEVRDSPDVLTCRLVDGKVTFVHRRLWPALARLADRLPAERLASVREEHEEGGRHRTHETPFDEWLPHEERRQAAGMSESRAIEDIGSDTWQAVSSPPRPRAASSLTKSRVSPRRKT